MAPIRKPVGSKTDELFRPVQHHEKHRLPPKGLPTCNVPLRRSARLREKNINRKVDCSSIPQRQSPKIPKKRGDKQQDQSQRKSKSPKIEKGEKSLSTKRKGRKQPHSLLTSRRVRDKQPETRDKRETRQEIHPNKGDPIDKWLGTVPLSLENLVDPFKENTSENTPQNSGLPSGPSQFSNSMPRSCTEKTPSPFSVRGSNFRNILGERNVFINNIEPSIELMKRAKEIFIDETFPKMDDSLAKNLAIDAKKLETKSEKELVRKLVTPLILAITEVPVQSLEMSEDKLWVRAINVPLDPDSPAVPITLSRPRPDFVFGYPIKSFNKTRLNTIKLLVAESHENYAMPDEAAIFPFLVVEAKAQAAGGTHFVASNQAAHAGAVAMLGTLELARRISAEEDIDLDQPQFFSISIDYATAHINAHWLCRDTENGAFCFHMRHLQTYLLDADGLKAVNLAVKNILHFGVTKRLANICRDLDTYSQKIKKKAIIDQSNLASNLRPEEQHQ